MRQNDRKQKEVSIMKMNILISNGNNKKQQKQTKKRMVIEIL